VSPAPSNLVQAIVPSGPCDRLSPVSRASRQSSRSLLPVIAFLSVLLAVLVTYDVRSRATPAARTVPSPVPSAGDRPAARALAARTPVSSASRDTSAWPLHGRRARQAPVPILMWHVVAEPRPGAPYPELWVSPAQFKAQVAALRHAGFTAITMGELWRAWHGSGRLPARPVVLSFDDGDLSHLTRAAPVLADVGWPGVLNLAVNHMGPKGLPRWAARRLVRGGWEIGSHTVDHLDLTTLSDGVLADQLTRSRRLIRAELGVTARFFCYPAGRNDDRVRAAVAKAGYAAATTTVPGVAAPTDDPFLLPRIRVGPETAPATLVQQASGTAASPVASGPA
jgi:peptidoglycan/xylan/chitin deacetylase (PgdA/CDA1 family)